MEGVSAVIVAASGRGVKTAFPGLTLTAPADSLIDAGSRLVTEPEYLRDYAPSERPWDVHRSQADGVTEIYRVGGDEFSRYAARILKCSLILDYAWIEDARTREAGVLRFKLRSAFFCRVRTCPVCQWRRSLMWFGRFAKALDQVLANSRTSISFIFLTMTVQNCEVEELRSTLRMMALAWRRFIMRKEFLNIRGWIRTTEVNYGKDGTAHTHFHVLLMVNNSSFSFASSSCCY